MKYFCPNCFTEVLENDKVCSHCHLNIREWEEKKTYTTRLVQALHHPLDEVRMGSIITLGNQADPHTAASLAECAYRYPTMVPQNLQIIASLLQFPASRERDEGFRLLSQHPSKVIAKQARKIFEAPEYERAETRDDP